jgi:uncharacterized protein YndB with AHSA1/START domain
MPDILHKVELKASTADTYRALATIKGLAGWWTHQTTGRSEVDGNIVFRFGERGGFEMRVLELEPEKSVLWQVVNGPRDWIGTKVRFDLRPNGDATAVLFRHEGWKEPVEFMHHCSTKWATFLMSLKAFVEHGKGAPYPNDVHITATGD